MENKTTLKLYLIPILVYLAFIAIYTGISAYNSNEYLYKSVWDVEHYQTISYRGYEAFPCTHGVNGRAGEICGNVGWYPMWPLVVRWLRPLFGGSAQYSFLGLAFSLTFIAFMLMFHFMLKKYGLRAAILALLALALGPASFYLVTGFPYALFMLLFMIYLILLYSDGGRIKHIFLFITAVAVSLTYPSAILIGVIPVVKYWFEGREAGRSMKTASYWLHMAGYVFPFVLGPLILWTYFYVQFDDFFLQLHFQEKYDRTWAFPLWIMLESLFKAPLFSPENMTVLWYGLVFIIFYPFKIKRELWIAALVFYLFSLTTGTTMSIYRHYLIIFPAYMIIGASSRPIWLKIVYIVLGLVISLEILFPLFMQYRLM